MSRKRVQGNGSEGYVNLSARRKKRNFEVPTSIGKVLCKRLNLAEALAARGTMIDVAEMAVAIKDGKTHISDEEQTKQAANIRKIVTAAVVFPPLVEDPDEGDTLDDFPFSDQLLLFHAVMDSISASPDEGKKILP